MIIHILRLTKDEQLEKLLQKNYFLHQSARDGYRSYLQAYASYSLKKIFDVNSLDLAKVGKAFGFSVPPRVNVNIGTGKTMSAPKMGKKRTREEDEEVEEVAEEAVEAEGTVEEDGEPGARSGVRRGGKERRIETAGRKKVGKEVYKKGGGRKKQAAGGGQWSR